MTTRVHILGIESSCDETGVALYDSQHGIRAQCLHSQVSLHAAYGGVVPELASRDHIQRLLPLIADCLRQAQLPLATLDAIAYTAGPGLAGALLVGASVAHGLAFALDKPAVPVHHLEGHLLSPKLATPAPEFPFMALLVSGGHSQLVAVEGVGRYTVLGETVDDAAGEAFDKTATLLGLGYPGGPALSQLAMQGAAGRFTLPRPMLRSDDLDFSFSGLKTAAMLLIKQQSVLDTQTRADIAYAFQEAIVEVLVQKSSAALTQTGMHRLVVVGGVSANDQLRSAFGAKAQTKQWSVYYPPLAYCTDNGAMIAYVGAQRFFSATHSDTFSVWPRWPLSALTPA